MAVIAVRPTIARNPRRIIAPAVLYVFVIVFLLSIILPIYYIFLTAFSEGSRLFTEPLHYVPSSLNFAHFEQDFNALPLVQYFLNTIFLAVVATLAALFVSFLGAYAIARLTLPGANVILVSLLASSMLPGVTTVIPLFQMYRQFGLLNTLEGLLILYVSAILPITTWLFVSFLKQIPSEVEEAAQVDGAGIWPILWNVTLPMIRAGVATLFLINFIVNWNEFFIPLIFAPGGEAKVITMALFEAQSIGSSNQFYQAWGNVSAVALIAVIPIFILTLTFQRQIVEGIMAGVFK